MNWKLIGLLAIVALGGCSGGTEDQDLLCPDAGDGGVCPSPSGTGGDAGLRDGGIGGDQDAGGGSDELTISAALGLFVTNVPTSGESPVDGWIMVQRGHESVSDAQVKLNGVTLPPATFLGEPLEGTYDAAAASGTGIGAGSTIVLEATTTDPAGSVRFQFDCPQDAVITRPAENSIVSSGQTLDVSWSGTLENPDSRLGFFACFIHDDPSNGEASTMGHGDWFQALQPGQTTAQLPVTEDCRRYLLELRVAGEQAFEMPGNLGTCYLQNRIWLKGPPAN